MKKALLIFLAIALLVTAVPAVSFAEEEPSYMEAVGELNKIDFLSKYAMTGSVDTASGDYVGTGSTLTRKGEEYTVIVRGDINGDGQIKSVDYLRVKKHFSGQLLDGLALIAGDVNQDNEIKSVDYLKIKSYLKGAADLWTADAYVGERYTGYRIWNFEWQSMNTYRTIIPACKEVGFNMINLHFAWYNIEQTEGTYDWSRLDEIMDYIINDQGMSVCAIVYLARKIGDGMLDDTNDYARDMAGKVSDEGRTAISFSSDVAVEKATRFYKAAVEHINERYGKNITMYLTCTSQYCEMEYCVNSTFDYNTYSVVKFRDFLEEKYGTIEALNSALGRSYKSFSGITPPGTTTDEFGLLWYQFKQSQLTNFINMLADATHEVDPSLKYCLQFGSVANSTAVSRACMDLRVVAEKADIVWVDDGPGGNHNFSMDYLRNFIGKEYEIGNEIDGPGQQNATHDYYLKQGLDSFKKGAKYIVCANWGNNPAFSGWGDIWETFRDEWLTFEKHEVDEIPANGPVIKVSLRDIFATGIGAFDAFYSNSLQVDIADDLTNYTPDVNDVSASYPRDYATVQNVNGWSYKYINKGSSVALTFSANRWANGDMYFLRNVCNPGLKRDLSLEYKVTAKLAGERTIEYGVAPFNQGGNGVGLAIYLNGEQIFPAEGYAVATYSKSLYGTLENVTLKADDVLSFRYSSMGDNVSDASYIKAVIK